MLKRLSKKIKLVRGKEKLLGLKCSCAFFAVLRTQFWNETWEHAEHFVI